MILTSAAFQDKLQDAENRVIRSKIDLYNTNMCVNTTGIPFVMYAGQQNFSDQRLPAISSYGIVPNLSLSWSYGAPFYMNLPDYTVDMDGYFYSEEAGNITFRVYGEAVTARLDFIGSNRINNVPLTHSPSVSASTSAIAVSASTWYEFVVQFWGASGHRNAGITVTYQYGSGEEKVVSAGVCSYNNSFISATEVASFNDIKGNRVKNEPTTYSFSVPFGDETGAYKPNASNEYTNGTANLKEGKLIKIFAGYECDSTPNSSQTEGDVVGDVEYIPRFTGYIGSFDIDRSSNKMTVHCIDFFGNTEADFCTGFPDASSYHAAGYFNNDVFGEPAGLLAPTAYDMWGVVPAIKDLFMKAGIPASLFYDMEKRRATDGTISDAIPSVYAATVNTGTADEREFQLSAARYYGTSQVEEYVNAYDTGTTIHEAIMKIVDTYGYFIDFKPNGNLRFYPQDNPTADVNDTARIDDSSASEGGTCTDVTDDKATAGNYTQINNTSSTLTFSNIAATGFTLIVKRDTTSGVDDNNNQYWSGTAGVTILIKINGGGNVVSYNYNLRFDQEWFYTDGVSPLTGSNPCILSLDHSLPYDNYDVIITNLNGTYNICVDELWVYHHNTSSPVKDFQTYKTVGGIASINKVDFTRDIKDLRNDVLTVGQRRGIWVPAGDSEVGISDPEMLAESNNQYVNYHARAVDVESIYNPSADNYVGRHMMTYIQEPNINTDARARWLSYSILNSYRDFDDRVDVDIVGDPEATIGDPITVLDKVEDDGTNLYWVVGVDESINDRSWSVALDVVGKKPYPSYDENPDYTLPQFNDRYFSGFTVEDNWGNDRDGTQKSTLNGDHGWGVSSLSLNSNIATWSETGTVVVYDPDSVRYGIFVYDRHSSSALWGYFVNDGPTQGYPYGTWNALSGWRVENIYNPYEKSDYGSFIKMRFTCLVDGQIHAGIKDIGSGMSGFVAGLSGGGGISDSGIPRLQNVYPGDIVELIWGGVDETGATHQLVSNEEIGGGFFAEDGKYEFTLDYTRSSDGETQPIYSGYYKDEDNVEQYKPIELAKSDVDNHQIAYTYATGTPSIGTYGIDANGGNSGRLSRSFDNNVGRQNTNLVWTKGEDGAISLTFKSHYLDANRKYFITYDVGGTEIYAVQSPLTSSDEWHQERNGMKGVDDQKLNDGDPVPWSYSDGYIMNFDPNLSWFGGIRVDQVFANRYNESIFPHTAVKYFIRLLLDIRDASGRRVILVDSDGRVNRRPQQRTDITDANSATYTEYWWDTAFEILVIPSGVQSGDFSVNWSWPSGGRVETRIPFEADTRYNLLWW